MIREVVQNANAKMGLAFGITVGCVPWRGVSSGISNISQRFPGESGYSERVRETN